MDLNINIVVRTISADCYVIASRLTFRQQQLLQQLLRISFYVGENASCKQSLRFWGSDLGTGHKLQTISKRINLIAPSKPMPCIDGFCSNHLFSGALASGIFVPIRCATCRALSTDKYCRRRFFSANKCSSNSSRWKCLSGASG